ncbi:MAG TPA: copper amine oxidase N-terminal domain-containing protein, partial [Candidatus Eremiobacteraceae bacterium]|nr:copper amine oxidase N-terminal domain-containing protein [Candidatus Eremiobacteraceae bacterium]
RSGSVFVPLRGVFERLGASVVYDNGKINATGNGRTISLTIGSTTAVVNGQPQTLDVAPFLVGSRTLVPLRFISQALGAAVDYASDSDTVTITSGSPGATAAAVTLTNLNPADQGVVQSNKPAISATFSQSVDPNSVKVLLDDRDVTSATAISPTDVLFTPPYSLAAQSHTVKVEGTSAAGATFSQSWSFTSGTSTAQNYVNVSTPAQGATVGGTFTVAGTALPGSHIHIVAASVALYGGVFRVPSGSYAADLTADSTGAFSQVVTIQVTGGGAVTVRITASKQNSSSATVTLNLNS